VFVLSEPEEFILASVLTRDKAYLKFQKGESYSDPKRRR
jgi:hypothetical protein